MLLKKLLFLEKNSTLTCKAAFYFKSDFEERTEEAIKAVEEAEEAFESLLT